MKYIKKAEYIEAIQMTEANLHSNENWPDWLHEAWQKDFTEAGALFPACKIHLLEKRVRSLFFRSKSEPHEIREGDYIVKDNQEVFICGAISFERLYEKYPQECLCI